MILLLPVFYHKWKLPCESAAASGKRGGIPVPPLSIVLAHVPAPPPARTPLLGVTAGPAPWKPKLTLGRVNSPAGSLASSRPCWGHRARHPQAPVQPRSCHPPGASAPERPGGTAAKGSPQETCSRPRVGRMRLRGDPPEAGPGRVDRMEAAVTPCDGVPGHLEHRTHGPSHS